MKRKEGFTGQNSVNLPGSLLQGLAKDADFNQLYLTDIGFYPNAVYHFRERKEGCSEYILIFCVAGKGWFQINKEKKRVEAGQFFILPADRFHAYGSQNDDPWTIYWVHFTGNHAAQFSFPDNDLLQTTLFHENDQRVFLFDEIIALLGTGLSSENLSYAMFCLGHLLAMFKYNRIYLKARSKVPNDACEKAISFMQKKVYQKVKLEEIAQAAQLSPSHFSSIFKKRTQRAPMEYFIFLKIQKSCHLLDTTNMRIKEISSSLGFEDPYYFSRLFGKVMLVSPLAYRKMRKG
jgi:AraC-like DNA-binding protein